MSRDPAAPRPARRSLPLRRKLLFAGLLLAIMLVGAIVLLELGIRLANRAGFTPLGPYERVAGVGFKLTARMPGMNSRGFRDREHPETKAPGTFRVAMLGDSYVWGAVPYEQNFPTLLEAQLNALGPDRTIEIVNLGQPGYGPGETLALWRSEAPRLQADAAIYGFYLGNDFTDPNPHVTRRAVLGEYLVLDDRRWLDRSLLFALLRHKWIAWRAVGAAAALAAEPPADDPAHAAAWEYHLSLYTPGAAQRFAGQAVIVKDLLAQLRDVSREAGAPLFVLAYPAQLTIDPALRGLVARRGGLNLEGADFGQLSHTMDSILTELELPHADISAELGKAADPAELYTGTHWNAAGNAAAAAAMLPSVRALLEAQGVTFGQPSPQAEAH